MIEKNTSARKYFLPLTALGFVIIAFFAIQNLNLKDELRELENPIIQTQSGNATSQPKLTDMSESMTVFSEAQSGFNKKTPRIELTHELNISPNEDSPATLFYFAFPVKSDVEGNIYVAESWSQETCTIKKFDSKGKYLFSIGRKGNGPGEFLGIFDFAFELDTILTVFDAGTARITRFSSATGSFLSSVGIHFDEISPPEEFHGCAIAPGGSYYISFYDPNSDKVIHKFDSQGKHIASFGSPFQLKESHSAYIALRSKMDNAPGILTIANEALWFTQNNPYEIRRYSLDGVLQHKITRKNSFMPPARVEIKGDNRYKFWIPSQSTGLAIWKNMIINCVWVPKHVNDRMGTVIDFFSLEGQLLSSIALNERILFTHVDDKGKIYGVERDEDVSEKIVRYALNLSKL
jgi:hypothetical protein